MLRAGVLDDDDEPVLLAVYCPYCAEREFGPTRIDSGQPESQ
jgi:hypothetical protein